MKWQTCLYLALYRATGQKTRDARRLYQLMERRRTQGEALTGWLARQGKDPTMLRRWEGR